MADFSIWLTTALERYNTAKNLIDELSSKDPYTQPYKSKYEAQSIFQSILDELSELDYPDNVECSPGINQVSLIKILLRIELGAVAVDTEETSLGEKFLASALNLLNELFKDELRVILFKTATLNQLGYIWCSYSENEKAFTFLKEAEEVYLRWKSSDNAKYRTLNFKDAFKCIHDETINEEVNKKIENLYTQTLYFLAQLYEKSEQSEKAAIYCNHTLKRQYDSDDFDPIDWAINSATLSQYFAVNGNMQSAQHHLLCASFVLSKFASKYDVEEERYLKSKADVSRIVVKYCLMLLETNESVEPKTVKVQLLIDQENLLSESLKDIPLDRATTFEEARLIFLTGQSSLQKAKEYYTINEHASDYVECVMDHSKLYRSLVDYEGDQERKCKIHKRRINLLEDLLKELNPKYFMSNIRQINFELGEIYSEMVHLKTNLLGQKDGAHLKDSTKKINALIVKSISNFTAFIGTFENKSTNSLPNTLDDIMVKPIMVAYTSIGRLYTKFLGDPKMQIGNWSKCETFYKKVICYMEANPQQEQLAKEEHKLVKEMLQLIPGKLNMLMNATMY